MVLVLTTHRKQFCHRAWEELTDFAVGADEWLQRIMKVGRRQQGIMTTSFTIEKIFLHVCDLFPVFVNLIS